MDASLFEKHPRLTLLTVVFLAAFVLAGSAELGLRFLRGDELSYYTGIRSPGLHKFPYGEIRINSHGRPDDEFDLNDPRPRIGYFGDSVTLGVGAGMGYRYADQLEKRFPEYQHLIFAAVSTGIRADNIEILMSIADDFSLNTIVYGMNLNDILPEARDKSGTDERAPETVRKIVRNTADVLNGRSYVYSYFRVVARNLAIRLGYDRTRYEFFPQKYKEVVRGTVATVDELASKLRETKRQFCVIVFPYEMQISRDAEEKYASLGFRWEAGFIDRSAQKMVLDMLDRNIHAVDAYEAFVDDESDRDKNLAGEFYVHDKGGYLDWNHPNRAGHERIARYLAEVNFCGVQTGLVSGVG